MKNRALITAAAILALAAPAAAHAAPGSVKSACFSAASWGPNANDADRPCTTVIAPDNDQVRVIQGSASREKAECVISIANVNDARCHRIGANRAAPTPLVPPTTGANHPQAVCTTVHLCAAVTVPQEDGSGLVIVQAGSTTIRCTLSNPTEEAGRYSVPCSA